MQCNVPVNTNGDWPCLIEKYAIIDDTMTTRTLLPVVNKNNITEYDFAFIPLALTFMVFKLYKQGVVFNLTFDLHYVYKVYTHLQSYQHEYTYKSHSGVCYSKMFNIFNKLYPHFHTVFGVKRNTEKSF